MAQTEYNINHEEFQNGLAIETFLNEKISRAIETAAGAKFGSAVTRGTDKDRQAVVGGATGFLGIVTTDRSVAGAYGTNVALIAQKRIAAIMTWGHISVNCPAGCVPGDKVNFKNSDGVIDSGVAISGETQLNAFWTTTTAAGKIGVIQLLDTKTTAGT